jgi:hypothetical protein
MRLSAGVERPDRPANCCIVSPLSRNTCVSRVRVNAATMGSLLGMEEGYQMAIPTGNKQLPHDNTEIATW